MLPLGIWAALVAGLVLPALADPAALLPATVEVDLVFPRNNSHYSASPLFPFVFAVQNTQVAPLLDIAIAVSAWKSSNFSTTVRSVSTFYARDRNISVSNPYYWTFSTDMFQGREGRWTLDWGISVFNCTHLVAPFDNESYINDEAFVTLTIDSGAPQPNLTAAVAVDNATCSGNSSSSSSDSGSQPLGIVYDVQRIQDVPLREQVDGVSWCPVVSPKRSAANPCGARMDAATAANITATLTADACLFGVPGVSCAVAKSGGAGAKGRQWPIQGLVLFLAAVGWAVGLVV